MTTYYISIHGELDRWKHCIMWVHVVMICNHATALVEKTKNKHLVSTMFVARSRLCILASRNSWSILWHLFVFPYLDFYSFAEKWRSRCKVNVFTNVDTHTSEQSDWLYGYNINICMFVAHSCYLLFWNPVCVPYSDAWLTDDLCWKITENTEDVIKLLP